jgi:hypothetical protein
MGGKVQWYYWSAIMAAIWMLGTPVALSLVLCFSTVFFLDIPGLAPTTWVCVTIFLLYRFSSWSIILLIALGLLFFSEIPPQAPLLHKLLQHILGLV